MKIGVFGGTFDPPHIAHLILASECGFYWGLERILWVLTPNPPHKQDVSSTPTSDRLKLVQAAIAGNPHFILSRVEVDLPPPHYTSVTMKVLAASHPKDKLVYLMGGDSLSDLPTWHKPMEFLAACHAVGVMRRPGDQVDLDSLEDILPGVSSKVHFVNTPLLEISATDIRYKISAGLPYRYYLPPDVYRIIRENGIYDTSPTQRKSPELNHE
jgi:nicotinate-nucleotide adenylyltransferase